MSVETTTTSVTYNGNGVTTALVTTFPFFSETDLVVTLLDIADTETLQTLGVDYTVTGGDGEAGTVTMQTAPAIGYRVRIQRVVPLTQPVDLRGQGPYSPDTLEEMADRATMQIQQLNAGVIDASSIVGQGEANTAANLGTAGVGIVDAKSGVALGFKAIKAGDNITITDSAADHTVEISAADGVALSGAFDYPSTIFSGAVRDPGNGVRAARYDHVHAFTTPFSATDPETIGTANDSGISSSVAHHDHVHAHGDQAGGTLHAEATSGAAGFMSATDKAKLDGFGAASTYTTDAELNAVVADVGALQALLPMQGSYAWDGAKWVGSGVTGFGPNAVKVSTGLAKVTFGDLGGVDYDVQVTTHTQAEWTVANVTKASDSVSVSLYVSGTLTDSVDFDIIVHPVQP